MLVGGGVLSPLSQPCLQRATGGKCLKEKVEKKGEENMQNHQDLYGGFINFVKLHGLKEDCIHWSSMLFDFIVKPILSVNVKTLN